MEVRPFGLWPSPLSPDELASSTRLRDVAWDTDGRTLVWLEGRGPKGVLVCQHPGAAPRDLNAALSVRAQVGYGGGDFAVARAHAYFAEHCRPPLSPAASRRPSPADHASVWPRCISCACANRASSRIRPHVRGPRHISHRRCRRMLLAANPGGRNRLLHAASLASQRRPLGLDRVGSSADALGRHPPSAGPACAQPPRAAQPAHNRGASRRRRHRHCPALLFTRWPLFGLCLGRARLQQPLVPRSRQRGHALPVRGRQRCRHSCLGAGHAGVFVGRG